MTRRSSEENISIVIKIVCFISPSRCLRTLKSLYTSHLISPSIYIAARRCVCIIHVLCVLRCHDVVLSSY